MTTTNIALDELKDTIALAAKAQGITEAELHQRDQWYLDYSRNYLDQEVSQLVHALNQEVKLLSQALAREDLATAMVALLGVRIQMHALADLFLDMSDALLQLGWGIKDKWPEIPEEYQIPADYDYTNTNLNYFDGVKRLNAFNAEEDRLDALEQVQEVKGC